MSNYTFRNMLGHMRGGSALVNGTKYDLDAAGIAYNVKPADARRLLASKEWREATKGDLELSVTHAATAAFDVDLSNVPKIEDLMFGGRHSRVMAEAIVAFETARANLESIKKHEEKVAAAEAKAAGAMDDADDESDGEDSGGDAGSTEFADLADMDLDALKKRADALGVAYAPNIGKETLAQRVAEATAKGAE